MRCTRDLLLVALMLSAQAGAATLSVNTSADVVANDGLCTLREAITAANLNLASGGMPGECAAGNPAGQDMIVFAIPGAGQHVITVQNELPAIESSLSIDGYTQAGASPNTRSGLTAGFDAVLRVRIDGGPPAAVSRPGLRIIGPGASQVRIRGLEIANFSSLGCCADSGIVIGANVTGVEIVGNLIRNNTWRGVILSNGFNVSGVRIGGPAAADRNLIYGQSGSEAINLADCSLCTVENNWLGVAVADGQPVAAPNRWGIVLAGPGSSLVVRDNWIGGNSESGVYLRGSTQQVTVTQNLIGGGIPNAIGVLVESINQSAPVGNTISANLITGNSGAGVAMLSTLAGSVLADNLVQANRLYGNGSLELDLGAEGGGLDGVNANDAGDPDGGPNGRQNHPVLGQPVVDGGQFSVSYAIDSSASSYTLEFAFASQCDASGHGLAGQMLSDPVVLTAQPASGTASFTLPAVPANGFVSALATGEDGTSEFSACQPYAYADGLHANGFE